MISSDELVCKQCSRKIMPSISNRCMYCGAALPEEHHLSQEEKAELLSQKMERFKQNEENAEDINSKIRQDFAIPAKKKSRKERKKDRKKDNEAAITAPLPVSIFPQIVMATLPK